jgi:GAF domain-containing protein
MNDQAATGTEASAEVAALRARVAELEALEAERRRAEQVQSALYRIADAASAATDMPEFYAAMHRIIGELMYANHFYIALYDEARQKVSFPFYVDEVDTEGWPAPHVWLPIGAEKTRGMTGYVLRTGRPALITAETYAELLRQGEIERVGVPPVDWLGVPLITEKRTIGVVAVQSYSEDIRYTEQDKALLTFVAQHIATALSRARAIEETRQRNAELAIINSVGEAMTQQLDVRTITRIVGDKVREIFAVESTGITLFDTQTNLLSNIYYYDKVYGYYEEGTWPLGQGLISIVVQSHQPLVLSSKQEGLERGAIWATVAGEETQIGSVPEENQSESWLGVPIVVGEGVLGVVHVESYRQHNFDERSVRLLSTLAASMAVALENARLFDETKRLLAETEQRNAELATVNRIGQALAAELELDALIELTGEQMHHAFDADIVYVALHDRQSNMIDFVYAYGEALSAIRFGEGLTSRIIQTQQPLLINEDVAGRYSTSGAGRRTSPAAWRLPGGAQVFQRVAGPQRAGDRLERGLLSAP